MLPCFAVDDLFDAADRNSELVRQFKDWSLLGRAKPSNLAHTRFGHLGVLRTVPGASAPGASFGLAVLHVDLLGPEEQMIRSNAGRVVTVVQDPKAIRDRAEVQFPRYAVSSWGNSFSAGLHDLDPTVTLWINLAGPDPARIRPLNLFPESVSKWSNVRSAECVLAGDAAELSDPGIELPLANKEGGAAFEARHADGTVVGHFGAPNADVPRPRSLNAREGISVTNYTTTKGSDMNVPDVPNPEEQPEPQQVDTDGSDTTDDAE